MVNEVTRIFTIQWNPDDYPDRWVVRGNNLVGHAVVPDVAPHAVVGSLHEARLALPPRNLHRIDRHPDDTSKVHEVWL